MATSSSFSSLALFLLVVVCAARGASAATTHVVGDNQQWGIPRSASYYTDWASKQTFAVGDSLVFNFATGFHDVLQVSQSSYDACNIQSPTASYTTGPATISLNSSGTYYYICGIGSHCSSGQKMTLTVSAASPPTTTPPPPTSGGPTTPGSTAIPPAASSTPAIPSSPGPSSAGTPHSAAPSTSLRKAAIATVALTTSAAALLF